MGGIAVLIVGLCNEKISLSGAWDGIRIIFAGIFSTGRDAAGTLTWGFNAVNLGNMLFRATPLIMTGLSVAVAFKTGLFNIGAPGQYLMGTLVSLSVALGIAPTEPMEACLFWLWIAEATSVMERPSDVMRAGSSQTRIEYFEP